MDFTQVSLCWLQPCLNILRTWYVVCAAQCQCQHQCQRVGRIGVKLYERNDALDHLHVGGKPTYCLITLQIISEVIFRSNFLRALPRFYESFSEYNCAIMLFVPLLLQ